MQSFQSFKNNNINNNNISFRLFVFEKIILFYLASIVLFILVFSKPFSNTYYLILKNFLYGLFLFFTVYMEQKNSSQLSNFIRFWLPLFLFTFLYRDTGQIVHLIHKEWFDGILVSIDRALFGTDLGVWVERFDHPVLNEIFRLGYASYYLLIIFGAGFHYFRSDRFYYISFMSKVTLAFCLSYITFIIFPVEGPRFFNAHLFSTNMDGLYFSLVQQDIIHIASIQGGAFPSSHVAVALIVWQSFYKKHRGLFIIMSPFITALIIGTIWGRYHYAIDVVAGILLAAIIIKN